MTCAQPSSQTPGGGGRRGRTTESSKGQTRNISNGVKQWCSDRGLPEHSWAEPLVIGLYILERAADTWKPERSNLKRGLKFKSLEAIPAAIVAHGKGCQLDMSDVTNHECIKNLIRNLRRRLPFEQVAPVRAQPLTDERVETVLSYLDRLERVGLVHAVWVRRWRALFLVARASALRPSEIVRMRFSWVRRYPTARMASITVPVAKSSESPMAVLISAEIPGGVEALEALEEWTRTLDSLGYPTEGESRVFPRVVEARVFPRVVKGRTEKSSYCSVAGMKLADFAKVAAEYTGSLDPTTVPAGSNKVAEWRCGTCGRTWKTRVLNRTSTSSGCPHCLRTRKKTGLASRQGLGLPGPSREATVLLVDPVDARLRDSGFRADGTRSQRFEFAVIAARDEMGAEYKTIALAAGLDPRTSFERISAYGTRRGATVSLANIDANRETMRETLRHLHVQTATPYIEERDITLPPALTELDGWSLS